MKPKGYICSLCNRSFEEGGLMYRCPRCNGPLLIDYDYEAIRTRLEEGGDWFRGEGMWRLWDLLPLEDKGAVVSLEEGDTPLHHCPRLEEELGVKSLLIKDETRNPTGSFKDRGSSVGVSKTLEEGLQRTGTVSFGNMAVSTAAYSARADLPCYILIPRDTSRERVRYIGVYDPILIMVDGSYSDMYDLSLELGGALGIHFLNSDNPFRVEGSKTIAFELCEQLDWRPPEIVILPVSSGGLISSLWKGFQELLRIGLIEDCPRMVGVQASGCAPIVEAFTRGEDHITPIEHPRTIAHSIRNGNPPSGARALRVLRESKGVAVAVEDGEILTCQRELVTREGILVEPASAAPIAGLKKLLEEGGIKGDERIVIIATGSGLRDITETRAPLSTPPTIEISRLKEYMKMMVDKASDKGFQKGTNPSMTL